MIVLPEVIAAADRLGEAARTGVPCAPVRDLIGTSDLERAYGVQRRLARRRVVAGGRVVGRKVGLTSAAVQRQLGVDRPDLGVLFADMAHADGATISMARLLQPRAEAEVAFVLGADLADGELGPDQVAAAVDHVVAAIEVADSRVAGWDITFGDTVADNASAGVYVLGSRRAILAEVKPRDVEMRMTTTGQEDSLGHGTDCLGDPLAALAWLATATRDLGQPLRAGEVVLSGALGPMRPVTAGTTVTAEISGLGTVTAHFGDGSDAGTQSFA